MTYQSAVLIVPSHEVQAFAAPLRRRFQPKTWMHVPAHITLLVPFAPLDQLESAIETLGLSLAHERPFLVTLDHYNHFPTAIYLEPHDPAPILELFRRLQATFPEYPAYAGAYGPDLVPHLTVARFEEGEDIRGVTMPPAPNLTFVVDRLVVYTGSPDEPIPFVPRAVLRLRGEQ